MRASPRFVVLGAVALLFGLAEGSPAFAQAPRAPRPQSANKGPSASDVAAARAQAEAEERARREAEAREAEASAREAEARATFDQASSDYEQGKRAFDDARTSIVSAKAEVARQAADRSHGLVALPILYSAPETGVGVGAFALYYWHAGDPERVRPSQVRSAVAVTTKKQFQIDFGPSLWLMDDRLFIDTGAIFQYFPQPFFGIGNSVPDAEPELFDRRTFSYNLNPLVRVLPHAYAGLKYQLDATAILNRHVGGPLDVQNVLGRDGGVLSGLGPDLLFDSRDNVYAATRGAYFDLTYARNHAFLGSDFAFGRLQADARAYVPFGNDVLAFQVVGSAIDGQAPFYALSNIGGPSLRGVYRGMFIDNDSIQGQVDFRFPIFGPVTGSVFLGAGEVMRRLADFDARTIHAAGGGGLRYLVEPQERIGVRLDVAYAAEGIQYYLDVGEAF